MRPSRPAVLAAAVLVLEGLGLAGIVLVEVIGLASGAAYSTIGGLGLIGLTIIGAAALIAFAVGTLRRASWARSGGVVLQVLAIALGVSSLSLQPVPWLFTLAVGVPGVLGLILLIRATRTDGRHDSRLPSADD